MTESEWTRKLCKQMEQAGATVIAIVGSIRQQSGLPDRLIIHKDLVVLVEFKSEKGKLSLLQAVVHRDILRHGRHVFVATAPGVLTIGGLQCGTFATGGELLSLLRLSKNSV